MEDISLHILDIAENSITAGATRVEIEIVEDEEHGTLEIAISDDGRGMDEEFRKRVLDPFTTTRTTRPVGLGLSLLEQAARETGGDIEIVSEPGKGTSVRARFILGHIDLRPLGDIAKTMEMLVVGNPEVEFRFRYHGGDMDEEFDTGRSGA